MWEHLSDVELFEEWLYVYFNYCHAEVRVKNTLTRLEEALQARVRGYTMDSDGVLPGGEHNT